MSRVLVPRLRDTSQGDDQCKNSDRDIDEEDPAPSEAVGEDATDEGAAGGAAPTVAPQTASAPKRSGPRYS